MLPTFAHFTQSRYGNSEESVIVSPDAVLYIEPGYRTTDGFQGSRLMLRDNTILAVNQSQEDVALEIWRAMCARIQPPLLASQPDGSWKQFPVASNATMIDHA